MNQTGRGSRAAWLLCLLALPGCWHPYFDKHPVFSRATDTELRTVEGITPASASVAPPVTLSQALESGKKSDAPAAPAAELPPPRRAENNDDKPDPPCPAPTEPQSLGLEEARLSALANNLDLRFERVTPFIDTGRADAEEAKFQAVFQVADTFTRTRPPPSILDPVPVPTTTNDLTAGILVPLKTGGQFAVSQHILRTDLSPPGQLSARNFDADYGIDFTQPLLRNAGIAVTTAPIQLAKLQTRHDEAGVKLVAVQVLRDVEAAYWQLWAARQLLEVAREQVRLNDEQLRVSLRLVEKEIITQVDVERVRATLLLTQENQALAETNVRLRQRELERIMQRPELPVVFTGEVKTVTPPQPLGLQVDRQRMAQLGLANRMELFQVEVRLLSDLIAFKLAQNQRLPQLDITMGHFHWLGAGTTLGRALGEEFDNSYYNYSLGVMASVPLGPNQKARALIEQALAQHFQTTVDRERIRVRILTDIYDAADQVELTWQRILAAHQAVQAATRAYEGAVKRYPAAGSLNDVLLTRSSLGDAQSREAQAIADYQVALADLAVATGTMLGYGHVDLGPLSGLQARRCPDSP